LVAFLGKISYINFLSTRVILYHDQRTFNYVGALVIEED